MAPVAARRSDPDVVALAVQWQRALDAADGALAAAAGALPATELAYRRGALARERQHTLADLTRLARLTAQPLPWLSPVPLTNRMLGLPQDVRACVFDLDGVLTDSGALHAWAWGEAFDEFLLRLTEKTGWQFIRFDRGADYRSYLDGRPRFDGVHAFLDSRGIRLPDGRADDRVDADSAYGLARRKGELLALGLRQRRLAALAGARRYLEAAAYVGLRRAVVSASASTRPMLELAGLARLVDEQVDAELIRVERLRSRPAPDLLVAACARLGVEPEQAVTFTHSAAGVAAGHAAGLAVVGVADGADGEILHGFGAQRVVPSLAALLDPLLRESS